MSNIKRFCPRGHDKEITGRTKGRICIACSPIYNKRKYEKNPEKYRLRQNEYIYKKVYNISMIDYLKIFKKQNGKCAGCGIPQEELTKKLSVDHNHSTGKVRGLLCNNCNRGLGLLKDNLNILQNLLKYLENGL